MHLRKKDPSSQFPGEIVLHNVFGNKRYDSPGDVIDRPNMIHRHESHFGSGSFQHRSTAPASLCLLLTHRASTSLHNEDEVIINLRINYHIMECSARYFQEKIKKTRLSPRFSLLNNNIN